MTQEPGGQMKSLSRLGALAYSLGSQAAGAFYAFNNFTLPLFLSFYTKDAIIIGWLSSTRSVEQAFIQPFVGAWSDRTWTRFGRRAPFFLTAMPLSALFIILVSLFPHDPSYALPVIISVFAFSFLFNVGIDPYVALLADVTKSEQRGTINGIAGVFGYLGQFLILIIIAFTWGQHPDWVFYILAISLIGGFGIVALGVRERRRLAEGQAETRSHDSLVRFSLEPYKQYLRDRWRQSREAVKLLGVKFLYQVGINAAAPFLTLFVSREIGTAGWPGLVGPLPAVGSTMAELNADSVSQLVAAFFLLVSLLFAIPSGWLGDRFGKKRVFALGLFVMGLTAVVAAFAGTIPQILLCLVFLGFGNAAISILFFPYLSDLVPPDQIGEFQGLSAAAETGGIVFSVLIAGALIDLNLFDLKYRLVFIVTGLFLFLGVVAVAFVKARLAEPATAPPPLPAAAVRG